MFRAFLLLVGACLLGGIAAVWAQAPSTPSAPTDEILLENELPVSGPQVWLHLPLGPYYHPGALLPVEGRIVWPGGVPPGGVTGIRLAEGPGPYGPRYGQRFPAGGAGVFRFPIQAPAGVADLRFSLWQEVNGEPQDLLRTSLVPHLKVLPAQGRSVVQCGQESRFSGPSDWRVVVVKPGELPDRAWMYENVDLVILGRGSFHGISDGTLLALRSWVLGGGRLVIASAGQDSADVLDGAVRAGLTPMPPECGDISDWVRRWLGKRKHGVWYDERYEIVCARYRLGFGEGLFFMPSADANAVAREGMRALADPVLNASLRPARSDARVWRQPFEFFASGAVPVERSGKTVWWALIGAGCVLAVLAFARTVRTRYLAAGLSLGVIGLLSALLARTFPQPELTLARVAFDDFSLDGRCRRTTEWALCEGTWDPRNTALRTARGATLSPLYYNPRELREAVVALNGDNELICRFTPPLLPPSAPLFQSCLVRETTAGSPRTLDLPGEEVRLRLLSSGVGIAALEKGLIWVTDDGRRLILRPEGGTYRTERLADERRYVRERFPMANEATAGAWARALSAALDEARRQGRNCIVQCADRLPGEGLIRAQGVETEAGFCFSVRRADVEQESFQK